MEVNFKFEIGQLVYVRQELRGWHERYGHVEKTSEKRGYESMGELTAKQQRPSSLQVIERHLQQCYGGIQLHYHIRAGGSTVVFTEPELAASFDAVDPSATDPGKLTPRDA